MRPIVSAFRKVSAKADQAQVRDDDGSGGVNDRVAEDVPGVGFDAGERADVDHSAADEGVADGEVEHREVLSPLDTDVSELIVDVARRGEPPRWR
jgi:hypothetical protein